MKFKFYIIIICLSILVFGCNKNNPALYEGTLIYTDDLPFVTYNFEIASGSIFLKTSISDSDFPDGVRYYYVIPKDEYYQDFVNNIGNKVSVSGEETTTFYAPVSPDVLPDSDYTPPEKPYLYKMYDLREAKIVKVH